MWLNNAAQSQLYGTSDASLPAKWPEIHLFELRDVWCVGDQGSLFFSSGELFDLCQTIQRLPDKAVRRPIPMLSEVVEPPVFHLTGFSHENHGHFILHHLPRLIACRDLLQSIPEMRILVAPGHAKWQSRYLAALGIDTSRVLEASHGTLRLKRVFYVPWMAGSFKLVNPQILKAMREQFCQLIDKHETASSPILFISRQDAPDKRLENEADIIQATRSYFNQDVICVQLSKLNMKEQIRLFENARLVIGPLGQGLTNIIYCKTPRLITLDHYAGPSLHSASQMFSALAAASGGEGITLHANTTYQGRERKWSFPLDQYVRDLGRVSQIWWPEAK